MAGGGTAGDTMERCARQIAGSLAWLLLLTGLLAGEAHGIPYSGTLTLGVASFGVGTGSVFGAGSGTSQPTLVTVGAAPFPGQVVIPLAGITPFTELRFSIAGILAGSISGTPLQGRIPISGASQAYLYLGNRLLAWSVPLFTPHSLASGAGGAGLGAGGTQSVTFPGNPGLYVRLERADWSAGAVTVTGLSTNYTYHVAAGKMASGTVQTRIPATAMFTGSDARTPGGLGQILLVSPSVVRMATLGYDVESFALSATLTLQFVPEPGTLLLVGSGAVALAARGRRQRLRRARP
jgi:PEP-CTERM motif-containing protein